jgi:hypothetical protein
MWPDPECLLLWTLIIINGQWELRSPIWESLGNVGHIRDKTILCWENAFCLFSFGECVRSFYSLLRLNLPTQFKLGCSSISLAFWMSYSVCLSFLARMLVMLTRMKWSMWMLCSGAGNDQCECCVLVLPTSADMPKESQHKAFSKSRIF